MLNRLLRHVADDIGALPVSALQLVVALIALQNNMPKSLRDFLMAQIGTRADLRELSPAAEAVMRLHAMGPYRDLECVQSELVAQQALLTALALDDKLFMAVAFMDRLADRLQAWIDATRSADEDAEPSHCQPSDGHPIAGMRPTGQPQ